MRWQLPLFAAQACAFRCCSMLQGKLYHSTVCVNTRVLIMHGAFDNIVPSA